MKVVRTLEELRIDRGKLAEPVGFVPTMGYLHRGHLSLVERCRRECASTVVSIFVNPTQFGPHEDFSTYPRDLDRDLKALEEYQVDLVWTPEQEEMYPPNFQTWVTVERLSTPAEGKYRPGHFRGVTTIVAKLFLSVLPKKAYFGAKDYQQAQIICQMVRDLNFPLEVVICPTVREKDGLALSSRNSYLSPQERQAATIIYRALQAGRQAYLQGLPASDIRRKVESVIQSEPLARLEYVSCAHPQNLEEIEGPVSQAVLAVAAYIGKTRLIDNILLTSE